MADWEKTGWDKLIQAILKNEYGGVFGELKEMMGKALLLDVQRSKCLHLQPFQ